MTEASNPAGIEDESVWKDGRNPKRRCTAKRSDGSGEQCRRVAILGGTVCATHGGSTRHIKAKARQRLEEAADRMARELLGIATSAESGAVRLSAIKDALDRAGLKPPTTVELGGRTAFEEIFDDIASGSRAESRAARGIPDEPDGAAPTQAALMDVSSWPETADGGGALLDVEVVETPDPGDEDDLLRSNAQRTDGSSVGCTPRVISNGQK